MSALYSVEKKFGGGKVDPVKQRGTNEKITDKARQMFESSSGKKVPSKVSAAVPHNTSYTLEIEDPNHSTLNKYPPSPGRGEKNVYQLTCFKFFSLATKSSHINRLSMTLI